MAHVVASADSSGGNSGGPLGRPQNRGEDAMYLFKYPVLHGLDGTHTAIFVFNLVQ